MPDSYRFQETLGSHESSLEPIHEKAWLAWQSKNRLHDERIAARLTKAVKWACIATLLVTAALPLYIEPYREVPRFIVTAGAVIIMFQAFHTHRYVFAALFAATGLLYNPVLRTSSLAGNWQVSMIYMTVVLFTFSLTRMKAVRRGMSILPK